MRLLNKVLLSSVVLVIVASHADALDPLEKCRLDKLRALQRYAHCFLRTAKQQIKRSLTDTEREARLASCEARFKSKFEQAVARAAKRGASCPDNVTEALETVSTSLSTAQVSGSSQAASCDNFGDSPKTKRCVFEQSQEPFDLKAFVENKYTTDEQNSLVITAEAWGGHGKSGHDVDSDRTGGAGGKQGYAATTWSYNAFKDNSTTDLYIYVGKKPGCGGCGGSSSMIVFKNILNIDKDDIPRDTAPALVVAGGGGGGGGATVNNAASGDAGDGGIVTGVAGSLRSAPGGGANGGNKAHDGGGGPPPDSQCEGATNGTRGIGGYGGRKADDKDSDRAGWKNTDSPTQTAGRGGYGEKGSGGTGGGGYGGGGGNCSGLPGGGGGSLAAPTNYPGGSLPLACGSSEVPDAKGKCGQGGPDGHVVLNFLVQSN